MEINKAHIKYIEWRSMEELHEEIFTCISELRFTKDEQQFLEDLILNHTMGLLAGKSYELSRNVITRLTKSRNKLEPLLKKLVEHNNDLQSLLDEINNIEEMDDFKKLHNQLMSEFILYNAQFKRIKKQIFKLIKQVLKERKQIKLLN
jgi:uncharacterized protein YbcC (UPF0753/DUF2309 family)